MRGKDKARLETIIGATSSPDKLSALRQPTAEAAHRWGEICGQFRRLTRGKSCHLYRLNNNISLIWLKGLFLSLSTFITDYLCHRDGTVGDVLARATVLSYKRCLYVLRCFCDKDMCIEMLEGLEYNGSFYDVVKQVIEEKGLCGAVIGIYITYCNTCVHEISSGGGGGQRSSNSHEGIRDTINTVCVIVGCMSRGKLVRSSEVGHIVYGIMMECRTGVKLPMADVHVMMLRHAVTAGVSSVDGAETVSNAILDAFLTVVGVCNTYHFRKGSDTVQDPRGDRKSSKCVAEWADIIASNTKQKCLVSSGLSLQGRRLKGCISSTGNDDNSDYSPVLQHAIYCGQRILMGLLYLLVATEELRSSSKADSKIIGAIVSVLTKRPAAAVSGSSDINTNVILGAIGLYLRLCGRSLFLEGPSSHTMTNTISRCHSAEIQGINGAQESTLQQQFMPNAEIDILCNSRDIDLLEITRDADTPNIHTTAPEDLVTAGSVFNGHTTDEEVSIDSEDPVVILSFVISCLHRLDLSFSVPIFTMLEDLVLGQGIYTTLRMRLLEIYRDVVCGGSGIELTHVSKIPISISESSTPCIAIRLTDGEAFQVATNVVHQPNAHMTPDEKEKLQLIAVSCLDELIKRVPASDYSTMVLSKVMCIDMGASVTQRIFTTLNNILTVSPSLLPETTGALHVYFEEVLSKLVLRTRAGFFIPFSDTRHCIDNFPSQPISPFPYQIVASTPPSVQSMQPVKCMRMEEETIEAMAIFYDLLIQKDSRVQNIPETVGALLGSTDSVTADFGAMLMISALSHDSLMCNDGSESLIRPNAEDGMKAYLDLLRSNPVSYLDIIDVMSKGLDGRLDGVAIQTPASPIGISGTAKLSSQDSLHKTTIKSNFSTTFSSSFHGLSSSEIESERQRRIKKFKARFCRFDGVNIVLSLLEDAVNGKVSDAIGPFYDNTIDIQSCPSVLGSQVSSSSLCAHIVNSVFQLLSIAEDGGNILQQFGVYHRLESIISNTGKTMAEVRRLKEMVKEGHHTNCSQEFVLTQILSVLECIGQAILDAITARYHWSYNKKKTTTSQFGPFVIFAPYAAVKPSFLDLIQVMDESLGSQYFLSAVCAIITESRGIDSTKLAEFALRKPLPEILKSVQIPTHMLHRLPMDPSNPNYTISFWKRLILRDPSSKPDVIRSELRFRDSGGVAVETSIPMSDQGLTLSFWFNVGSTCNSVDLATMRFPAMGGGIELVVKGQEPSSAAEYTGISQIPTGTYGDGTTADRISSPCGGMLILSLKGMDRLEVRIFDVKNHKYHTKVVNQDEALYAFKSNAWCFFGMVLNPIEKLLEVYVQGKIVGVVKDLPACCYAPFSSSTSSPSARSRLQMHVGPVSGCELDGVLFSVGEIHIWHAMLSNGELFTAMLGAYKDIEGNKLLPHEALTVKEVTNPYPFHSHVGWFIPHKGNGQNKLTNCIPHASDHFTQSVKPIVSYAVPLTIATLSGTYFSPPRAFVDPNLLFVTNGGLKHLIDWMQTDGQMAPSTAMDSPLVDENSLLAWDSLELFVEIVRNVTYVETLRPRLYYQLALFIKRVGKSLQFKHCDYIIRLVAEEIVVGANDCTFHIIINKTASENLLADVSLYSCLDPSSALHMLSRVKGFFTPISDVPCTYVYAKRNAEFVMGQRFIDRLVYGLIPCDDISIQVQGAILDVVRAAVEATGTTARAVHSLISACAVVTMSESSYSVPDSSKPPTVLLTSGKESFSVDMSHVPDVSSKIDSPRSVDKGSLYSVQIEKKDTPHSLDRGCDTDSEGPSYDIPDDGTIVTNDATNAGETREKCEGKKNTTTLPVDAINVTCTHVTASEEGDTLDQQKANTHVTASEEGITDYTLYQQKANTHVTASEEGDTLYQQKANTHVTASEEGNTLYQQKANTHVTASEEGITDYTLYQQKANTERDVMGPSDALRVLRPNILSVLRYLLSILSVNIKNKGFMNRFSSSPALTVIWFASMLRALPSTDSAFYHVVKLMTTTVEISPRFEKDFTEYLSLFEELMSSKYDNIDVIDALLMGSLGLSMSYQTALQRQTVTALASHNHQASSFDLLSHEPYKLSVPDHPSAVKPTLSCISTNTSSSIHDSHTTSCHDSPLIIPIPVTVMPVAVSFSCPSSDPDAYRDNISVAKAILEVESSKWNGSHPNAVLLSASLSAFLTEMPPTKANTKAAIQWLSVIRDVFNSTTETVLKSFTHEKCQMSVIVKILAAQSNLDAQIDIYLPKTADQNIDNNIKTSPEMSSERPPNDTTLIELESLNTFTNDSIDTTPLLDYFSSPWCCEGDPDLSGIEDNALEDLSMVQDDELDVNINHLRQHTTSGDVNTRDSLSDVSVGIGITSLRRSISVVNCVLNDKEVMSTGLEMIKAVFRRCFFITPITDKNNANYCRYSPAGKFLFHLLIESFESGLEIKDSIMCLFVSVAIKLMESNMQKDDTQRAIIEANVCGLITYLVDRPVSIALYHNTSNLLDHLKMVYALTSYSIIFCAYISDKKQATAGVHGKVNKTSVANTIRGVALHACVIYLVCYTKGDITQFPLETLSIITSIIECCHTDGFYSAECSGQLIFLVHRASTAMPPSTLSPEEDSLRKMAVFALCKAIIAPIHRNLKPLLTVTGKIPGQSTCVSGVLALVLKDGMDIQQYEVALRTKEVRLVMSKGPPASKMRHLETEVEWSLRFRADLYNAHAKPHVIRTSPISLYEKEYMSAFSSEVQEMGPLTESVLQWLYLKDCVREIPQTSPNRYHYYDLARNVVPFELHDGILRCDRNLNYIKNSTENTKTNKDVKISMNALEALLNEEFITHMSIYIPPMIKQVPPYGDDDTPWLDGQLRKKLSKSAITLLEYMISPHEKVHHICNGFKLSWIQCVPVLVVLTDVTLKLFAFSRLTSSGDLIIAQRPNDTENSSGITACASFEDHRTREGTFKIGLHNFSLLLTSPRASARKTSMEKFGAKVSRSVKSMSESSPHRSLCWFYNINGIRKVRTGTYLHQDVAVDIRMAYDDGPFLALMDEHNSLNKGARKVFLKHLLEVSRKNESLIVLDDVLRQERLTVYTKKWVNRSISTFDYLMEINDAAGRSKKDWNQYPILPWVLCNTNTDLIDLNMSNVYRDFTVPIHAQTPEARANVERLYNDLISVGEEPCHHTTHYSYSASVLHFMIRMQPFYTMSVEYQGGNLDKADRLFRDMSLSFYSATSSSADCKELIPEFFTSPEFLRNIDEMHLGVLQSDQAVGDVILPQWTNNSSIVYCCVMRQALESEYVSSTINVWVDLIFGVKQSGDAAVKAYNTHRPLTYPEEACKRLKKASDDIIRNQIICEVQNFGQTPKRLFTQEHPRRMAYDPKQAISAMILDYASRAYIMTESDVYKLPLLVTSLYCPDKKICDFISLGNNKYMVAMLNVIPICGTRDCLCFTSNTGLRLFRHSLDDGSSRGMVLFDGPFSTVISAILVMVMDNASVIVVGTTSGLMYCLINDMFRNSTVLGNTLHGHSNPIRGIRQKEDDCTLVTFTSSSDDQPILWRYMRCNTSFLRRLDFNSAVGSPCTVIDGFLEERDKSIVLASARNIVIFNHEGVAIAQGDIGPVTEEYCSSVCCDVPNISCITFYPSREWGERGALIYFTGHEDGLISVWSVTPLPPSLIKEYQTYELKIEHFLETDEKATITAIKGLENGDIVCGYDNGKVWTAVLDKERITKLVSANVMPEAKEGVSIDG